MSSILGIQYRHRGNSGEGREWGRMCEKGFLSPHGCGVAHLGSEAVRRCRRACLLTRSGGSPTRWLRTPSYAAEGLREGGVWGCGRGPRIRPASAFPRGLRRSARRPPLPSALVPEGGAGLAPLWRGGERRAEAARRPCSQYATSWPPRLHLAGPAAGMQQASGTGGQRSGSGDMCAGPDRV